MEKEKIKKPANPVRTFFKNCGSKQYDIALKLGYNSDQAFRYHIYKCSKEIIDKIRKEFNIDLTEKVKKYKITLKKYYKNSSF